MGKRTREIITETDSDGREKTKTIEKEIIETAEVAEITNPYEFMTNAELLDEIKRLADMVEGML